MKLTFAGFLYVGLTLLLGFAAVNTGNNLLYLLVSALLGFMAVSGVLGQQNLLRLNLRIIPDRELYAGAPAGMVVDLVNQRRWFPACLLRIELAGSESLVPLLPPQQKRQLRFSLQFPERGYQHLPPVKISSCFPINFFVRSRTVDLKQKALVFPRPLATGLPAGSGERFQDRQQNIPQPGNDGELRSIDDYTNGDSVKAIHWKHSARQAGYKVKRLNRLGTPSLLLDLAAIPGQLEEKISYCTYLINHYMRQQCAVGLTLDDKRFLPSQGTAHRHRLLRELALYASG